MYINNHGYHVCIVGSGLAGSFCALKLIEYYQNEFENSKNSQGEKSISFSAENGMPLPHLKITILTKTTLKDSNSTLAQGGIAVARDENDILSHINDTIAAGCGVNDYEMTNILCDEGYQIVQKLTQSGLEFDRKNGDLDYALEGAHSVSRVLHINGDRTGEGLLNFVQGKLLALYEEVSRDNTDRIDLRIIENADVIELLRDNDTVNGVRFLDINSEEQLLLADSVILATGGLGNLYDFTSNHPNITADGYALAKRAGCNLKAMEFVQFHPTIFDSEQLKDTTSPLPDIQKNPQNSELSDSDTIKNSSDSVHLLISEAVRGAGGVIVDENGHKLMQDFDKKDLEPRDIVSRVVYKNKVGGHKNLLDISSVKDFSQRFNNIYLTIASSTDFESLNNKLPFSPGAHFFMGGVVVDSNAKTSMNGLYAIGEVAYTNVHGANRLASNSLLECLVFGNRCAKTVFDQLFSCTDVARSVRATKIDSKSTDTPVYAPHAPLPQINLSDDDRLKTEHKIRSLQDLCTKSIGIVRNEHNLRELLNWTLDIEATKIVADKTVMKLHNLALVAREIAAAALKNRQNIGAHFREDV